VTVWDTHRCFEVWILDLVELRAAVVGMPPSSATMRAALFRAATWSRARGRGSLALLPPVILANPLVPCGGKNKTGECDVVTTPTVS
jgi:hypothetical protein